MSLFSKIRGAVKGAAKVVTTPERLAVRAAKSVVGGSGGKAAPPTAGVGMIQGQSVPGGAGGFGGNLGSMFGGGAPTIQGISPSGGGGGLLGNLFHGSATAAPLMNPNMPPPPGIAVNGGAAPMGGLMGALAGGHGGIQSFGGAPIQPQAGNPAVGGLMGALQHAAGAQGTANVGMIQGQPGAGGGFGGSIAALLKAQQQGQGAGAGASNLLQSQYPGLE